jgi:hypothetical protein
MFMKIRTKVRAGVIASNHNAIISLKLKTKVRAGGLQPQHAGGFSPQHASTNSARKHDMRKSRLRTTTKVGGF